MEYGKKGVYVRRDHYCTLDLCFLLGSFADEVARSCTLDHTQTNALERSREVLSTTCVTDTGLSGSGLGLLQRQEELEVTGVPSGGTFETHGGSLSHYFFLHSDSCLSAHLGFSISAHTLSQSVRIHPEQNEILTFRKLPWKCKPYSQE